MTDYTALGNAIKTTLTANSWLGNLANVKVIETNKRGFDLSSNKDALFFKDADLPAIAVVANATAKQSQLKTTNEILETHNSQVITVSKHRDASIGLDNQNTIVKRIEEELEAQKSSAKDLGIDAFVKQVSTTTEEAKRGDHYYFISTTIVSIELTAPF